MLAENLDRINLKAKLVSRAVVFHLCFLSKSELNIEAA